MTVAPAGEGVSPVGRGTAGVHTQPYRKGGTVPDDTELSTIALSSQRSRRVKAESTAAWRTGVQRQTALLVVGFELLAFWEPCRLRFAGVSCVAR